MYLLTRISFCDISSLIQFEKSPFRQEFRQEQGKTKKKRILCLLGSTEIIYFAKQINNDKDTTEINILSLPMTVPCILLLLLQKVVVVINALCCCCIAERSHSVDILFGKLCNFVTWKSIKNLYRVIFIIFLFVLTFFWCKIAMLSPSI